MDPEKMADVVATAIETATTPLVKRIVALENRTKNLEQQPHGLKYRGVWDSTETPYFGGDVVSDKGSMWACMTTSTKMRPGESRDWQLCVKAGRDARDAKDAR